MRILATLFACTLSLGLCFVTPIADATDVDGGGDCTGQASDWGDAPEGVFAYPGVIGKFPTCRDMSVFGTQELPPVCPPRSSPPGPTGHIFHTSSSIGANYWLGCYPGSGLGTEMGIDRDPEGKMNQPAVGSSFCDSRPTDCVETAFGLTFDQDECYGDGSDAGLSGPPALTACQSGAITFNTYLCSSLPQTVFLNILVDMNQDGDWNDALLCNSPAAGCAYEWAVKNVPIVLTPGCGQVTSPAFAVGPTPGPAWLRISLMDTPASDDYPWAGGAGQGGFQGGETEDYPVRIDQSVPAVPSTWGRIKALRS